MNKIGAIALIPLILVVIAVAGLIYIANNNGLGLSVTGSDTFAKPQWARLECSAEDFKTTYTNVLSSQKLYICQANTEFCEFSVSSSFGVTLLRQVYYQKCDNSGSNCGSKQTINLINQNTASLPNINNGESYRISTNIGQDSYTKVMQSYNSYKLFRYYGGAKDIVNSFDCALKSGDLSKIRTQDYKTNILSRTGGVGQKWVNYVDDWVYGPATNIVKYKGQQGYCTGGKVYSIVKLQMKDGSLVQLNPDYTATLPSGEVINGLGSLIPGAECCPNEPSCGADFKYHQADSSSATQNTKSCFSDLQCYNAGGNVPADAYHYYYYRCIEKTCQKSALVKVECTSNAQCLKGQICDLSTMNYGKCITQKQGESCGDGICQNTESGDPKSAYFCSADCEFTCPEGQVLKTTYKPTFFSILGLAQTSKSTQCEDVTFWSKYGLWIILSIAVLLFFYFGFYRRNNKIMLGILVVLAIYLAYVYLGAGLSVFLVILVLLGFVLWIFRRQIFALVRFAI